MKLIQLIQLGWSVPKRHFFKIWDLLKIGKKIGLLA